MVQMIQPSAFGQPPKEEDLIYLGQGGDQNQTMRQLAFMMMAKKAGEQEQGSGGSSAGSGLMSMLGGMGGDSGGSSSSGSGLMSMLGGMGG